jgi:hypothetical protein
MADADEATAPTESMDPISTEIAHRSIHFHNNFRSAADYIVGANRLLLLAGVVKAIRSEQFRWTAISETIRWLTPTKIEYKRKSLEGSGEGGIVYKIWSLKEACQQVE